MKTYTTSGTGSGQTLSEIESDKMPIYNTMADAEADLANLEIGQIIAINTIGAERLAYVVNENGTKKIKDLTANVGTGAPVGSYLYLEKKSNPQGYLYCDGSTFDETAYPALYQYLGTNVLPDWRELGAKGAEKNTTLIFDSTETDPSTGQAGTQNHDVFTQGEFKDDQLQNHHHGEPSGNYSSSGESKGFVAMNWTGTESSYLASDGRHGTVTRGKSRAVFIYIKATSGLTENQQENVLNTINENNSYSTEEHPTGKKWIDGKPIYSKVIEVAGLSSGVTDINHGANIDKLISNNGYCEIYSQNRPFPFIDDGGNSARIATYSSEFIRISTNYPVSNLAIVLEYTKTTDN